ncbi:MAG TPA: hypothetical protein VGK96_17045 [Candidatus Sulfotelmatobacter sp.]
MHLGRILLYVAVLTISFPRILTAQDSSSSSTPKHTRKAATPIESTLDSGSIANGIYRNKMLGLSCKIPAGWVLRTDEMNSSEENGAEKAKSAQASSARVLLAAFSRPPEARAEDVNASILIAAEPASTYPGLNEAAQYFGPLTEVAKAQGFTIDEEPYEFAVGTKTLVRGDFHKDVGSRVMHQSTLALLSHGYAVSVTIIAGTEDEVEGLIDGLTFTTTGK